MKIRGAEPDDAGEILAIVRARNLPASWSWPVGLHGLVAEDDTVRAFAVLSETPWGIVVEELWEEPSRAGMTAVLALVRHIESLAQKWADERGVPVGVGGNTRRSNPSFIKAAKGRGYAEIAVVIEKVFHPG